MDMRDQRQRAPAAAGSAWQGVELIILSSSDEDDDDTSADGTLVTDFNFIVHHTSTIPEGGVSCTGAGSYPAVTMKPVDNNGSQAIPTSNNNSSSSPIAMQSDEIESAENILIKTLDPSECTFCTVVVNPGDGVMLSSCLHNYCLDCIRALISQSESTEIICIGRDEDGTTQCKGLVSDAEIKALLDLQAYQNYLNRSLNIAQKDLDLSSCQNPKCSGIFSLPKDAVQFKCTICELVTCVKCQSIRNDGVCKCATKRPFSGESEQRPKVTKMDEAASKAWDEKWSQISQSISKSSLVPSTSSGTMASTNADQSLLDVLIKMETDNVLTTTEEFNCAICLTDISAGDGVILKDCFHMFCRDCLAGTIEHCEETNVKCPFQVDNYSCPSFISDREIRALISPESHEKFLRRSVTQAELTMSNAFHCKTVNCTAWCEFEEGAEVFNCPVCKKNNCLKCRAIHETISCTEYRAKLDEDEMDIKTKKMLMTMINNGTAMKCPTCKIVIQRISGCDGMMCSVCKTHICWATKGPRWGPKGVGDRSGGCHCREVRGKLCHPKCKNCH